MRPVAYLFGVVIITASLCGCTAGGVLPAGAPVAGSSVHRHVSTPNDCNNDTGGGLTGEKPCSVSSGHF